MDGNKGKVVVAQMKARERQAWEPIKKKRNTPSKQLLRNTAIFAAVSLCVGGGAVLTLNRPEAAQSVMSHMTAGFDYDETLGRLQFVSNILPQSAMVFLTSDTAAQSNRLIVPESAQLTHAWAEEEPWLEYACVGDVVSCQDGEIMTIVQNRGEEYTVRILHDNGYESVYSGLSAVHLDEQDFVQAGQQIGTAAGSAAFELRKDGLSILPVFGENAP